MTQARHRARRHVSILILVGLLVGCGALVEPVEPTDPTSFAFRAGGPGYDAVHGVSATIDGTTVAGCFAATAGFGAVSVTTTAHEAAYVARLTPGGAWAWVAQSEGDARACASAVYATPDGGALIAGTFRGTARFGGTELASGTATHAFVAAVDGQGSWSWALQAGGQGSAGVSVEALADAGDGSAVLAGSFWGAVTFGDTTLTSDGESDGFVARLGPDRTWQWAVRVTGPSAITVRGASSTPEGDTIVVGRYDREAGFEHAAPSGTATRNTAFVARIHREGVWLWVAAGGFDAADAVGVATAGDGSSVVVGTFSGVATFGDTSVTSAGGEDVFVAWIDADGEWRGATRAGGSADDVVTGVAAASQDRALVTGRFAGAASIGDAQQGTVDGSFVAAVESDGAWSWLATADGTGVGREWRAAALPGGGAMVAGGFWGTVAFGDVELVSEGLQDVFVARLDELGRW
jgi:hypothetical protein